MSDGFASEKSEEPLRRLRLRNRREGGERQEESSSDRATNPTERANPTDDRRGSSIDPMQDLTLNSMMPHIALSMTEANPTLPEQLHQDHDEAMRRLFGQEENDVARLLEEILDPTSPFYPHDPVSNEQSGASSEHNSGSRPLETSGISSRERIWVNDTASRDSGRTASTRDPRARSLLRGHSTDNSRGNGNDDNDNEASAGGGSDSAPATQ